MYVEKVGVENMMWCIGNENETIKQSRWISNYKKILSFEVAIQ